MNKNYFLEFKIFKKKSPGVLYGGSVDGSNVGMFKEIREIDDQIISLVLQRKKILGLFNYKIDKNYGNL